MSWSKEQVLANLSIDKKPQKGVLLKRGEKYMTRDVPDGYFRIQDWCVSQGISIKPDIPDLIQTLQGVEYILQAGTGRWTESLTQNELTLTMHYLNREDEFEGGALRQYPELLEMVKRELLILPKGKEIIRTLGEIPEYRDLFG